jgi:hypothetical protein
VAGSTKRLRDSVSLPSSLSLTHSHEGTCYLTHSHLLPCSLPLQGAEESKRSPGSPGPLRRHSSLGNLPAWWTLHSPAPTASATRPSTRSHSVLRKGTFRMDSCCVTYVVELTVLAMPRCSVAPPCLFQFQGVCGGSYWVWVGFPVDFCKNIEDSWVYRACC